MPGLPWEDQPSRPNPQPPRPQPPRQDGPDYTYQQAPRPNPEYTYQRAPVPPPPQYPQDMRYDLPPEPPQPRRPAPIDIQGAIQDAVNQALVQSKDHLQANAQRALVKGVQGKKPTVQHRGKDESIFEEITGDIEEAWTGGPVTTRTFVQGMAVDVGFAMLATLATVMGKDFNAFDKEAWTVVGVLMLKTLITTGLSYMMKVRVN
jgi:hypothetical protein